MASLCRLSTVPCCILAGEMSICRPALILPLCMTQSATLDSLTQRMFHGGTEISTFSAQLVDCQLQFFFPPSLLHTSNFFLSYIRANQCLLPVWVQRQSNVSEGTHKTCWLNKSLFLSIDYSLLTVTPARPICASRFMNQCGTKKKFVLVTWVKDLETAEVLDKKQKKGKKKWKKENENLVWRTSQWYKPLHSC